MSDINQKIQESLDKVRPSLQADGGDIEFVDFDEATGVVNVRLTGMCHGCPMAQYTLKQGVEMQLKADVSEVKEVNSL